ncbi:MAG: hypothetical protein OEY10_00320 [Nitrosopumilus sp.]|nr:hypothetical protein [Nitrosopumilus sp.]
MSKKELEKKETTALALAADMEADAGLGYENLDPESQTVPYIIIAQSLTPVANPSHEKYIEGARPGMFFNTVTEELFPGDVGLFVIPCGYKRVYAEWERGESGEYITTLDPTDPKVQGATFIKNTSTSKKEFITREDTRLVDTRYHACLVSADGENYTPVMIKFRSTQINKSKQWNTIQANCRSKNAKGEAIKVAPWWQLYKLTTAKESKDKNTWYGFKIDFQGFVENKELANIGREFNASVVGGGVVVKDENHDVDIETEPAPF